MKQTKAKDFSQAQDAMLEQAAICFQALSDPTRLRILQALKEKEQTVQELVGLFNWSQPNISRHLTILARAGFVRKSKRSAFVFYGIKNSGSLRLCDQICSHLQATIATFSK
jgi:ArsR family transcriptional regulator